MRILPLLAAASVALSACAPSAPVAMEGGASSAPASAQPSSGAGSSAAVSKAALSKAGASASAKPASKAAVIASKAASKDRSAFTEQEWKAVLTPAQYAVLRQQGTERPFTSPLLDEHRAGTFVTADCGDPVFRSEQKFDSGTGWPSFWAPITPDAVVEVTDTSHGMTRTEIRSRCGGHLGHVFTDGPEPTGLRYCMNGLALRFIPDEPQPGTTEE